MEQSLIRIDIRAALNLISQVVTIFDLSEELNLFNMQNIYTPDVIKQTSVHNLLQNTST